MEGISKVIEVFLLPLDIERPEDVKASHAFLNVYRRPLFMMTFFHVRGLYVVTPAVKREGHIGTQFQIVHKSQDLTSSDASINPPLIENQVNPMRRDTVTVPARTHVVIRFVADNPGIWALHCHVAWHMEGMWLLQFRGAKKCLLHLCADAVCLRASRGHVCDVSGKTWRPQGAGQQIHS